jgi:RNA polymerase sigma factor (sigma-70 family)
MKDTRFSSDNNSLVVQIKNNDPNTLKSIYKKNYPKVEALVLKNSGNKDEAKDIFQEAFIVVWQNIRLNKFIPNNQNSVDAYLYAIAKNKWMDVLRSNGYKNTLTVSQLNYFEVADKDENFVTDDDILNDKRLQDTMHAFNLLGEACRNLLMKFYFEKLSMSSIASELQLDEASTRNKKYRCMQKLREIALNKDK